MNTGTTRQYDAFVFRRLTEPVPLFGHDVDPRVWLFVLFAVLLVGIVYIGFMYSRDSRGVGWGWACLLGFLRLSVYGVIAVIFLLPSRQSWEEKSSSSKVLVLFDASQSMSTRDDMPDGNRTLEQMPTRQDKVMQFLAATGRKVEKEEKDAKVATTSNGGFFDNLTKRNPATLLRFASTLDPNYLLLDNAGRSWTKEEAEEYDEKRRQPGFNNEAYVKERPLAPGYLRDWLNPETDPNAKPAPVPEDLSAEDKSRYEALLARNKTFAGNRFFSGTNLGDATLNTINRELNNMVQGVIIFTDGRSTEGGEAAFELVAERAKAAHIPIFVVGIGEERPQVRLEITDLRAPQQVQPEDKFPIIVEVTGEGLAKKEVPARLDLTYTRKKENGKEEELEIYLVEQEDKKAPKKDREVVNLGKKLTLTPEKPPVFDEGTPPRVEIEYSIDAAALAKAADKVEFLSDPAHKGKKWEIGETKDGEFRLQASVPKDRLELYPKPEHKSDIVDMRVLKRPIRVLLFASAATHDFQFLNNMLIREVEQQRAELSVYVQPPPGKDAAEWLKSVVLGVQPDRLLVKFPDRLDQPSDTPAEKIYDLSEYDVIVAFDPDWSKLTDDQLKLVNKWCDKGGGIVLLGGPINTLQLARPGPNREKLKPVLDLLPVVLKDVRIEALDRTTENPWPLNFEGATPEMEFLRLAEETDKGPPPFLDDWKEFFYGTDGKGIIKRGFFNYYPVDLVKSGSIIVARFMDPRAKMKDGTQMPYIVLSDASSGRRVVWIAWGEMRRLRQHSESFYERFWTKLVRYAGAGNQTNLAKRVRIDMNRTFTAGRFVSLDAKIDVKVGDPLIVKRDSQLPTIELKLPAGVSDKEIPLTYKMTPKKGKGENDLGKFSARFQVKSPGDYQLTLKVPETNDTVIQKFNVKESNPELDNVRPDFEQMYRLASEAEAVLVRLPEADRQELKRRLKAPDLTKPDDKKTEKDAAPKDGKLRLYFDLKNAELIPSCMVTETKTQQNRGPYKDTWDAAWDFRGWLSWMPGWLRNALVVIVGLLSVEWLIRKLLRLA